MCGYEESITEKKISTKTSSVTKNNLLNNIDKIHTSYKSDSKVIILSFESTFFIEISPKLTAASTSKS